MPETYEGYVRSLLIRRSAERQIQMTIELIMDICALQCKDNHWGIQEVKEESLIQYQNHAYLVNLVKRIVI